MRVVINVDGLCRTIYGAGKGKAEKDNRHVANTLIRAKLGNQKKGSCTTADWLTESMKSHLDSLLDSRGHAARCHRIKNVPGESEPSNNRPKTLLSTGNGPRFSAAAENRTSDERATGPAKLPGRSNSRNSRQLGTLSNSCSEPHFVG
jgi:hypothetical protein